MQNRTGVGGAWIELRGASSCYQPSRQPGQPHAPPSIFMRHEISSSMDEQQSPQRGLVPPPLPSPGSAGGSHGHEYNIEVKAEAVAGAMREPQNTHPRKAAEAAVTMVKLANVAAHAGHEPAACLLRHGVEAAAAKITRYWSVAPRLAMPPPKMDPTAAKKCGSNINLLAHVGVVRALHGLFSKCSCSSGCPLREGSACAVHVVPPPPRSRVSRHQDSTLRS